MRNINVLVFPCGSEIGIEIYNCLYQQKGITLFGASSVDDNGQFFYTNYIGDVPYINDDKFLSVMRQLVKKHKISYIYPTMDVAITALKNLEEQLGCVVLSSPKETVDIIARKSTTYNHFKDLIRVPKQYDVYIEFPAFSKPDIGASSRNTLKIETSLDYNYCRQKYPANIYLEYLPGAEYTVDCFNDANGNLLFCSARERSRIVNGISVGTSLLKDAKIDEMATTISNNLKLTGSWFFQVKKDKNGEYCLLEIASRFAGSSVLNRLHGVNFAYLNILKEKGDVKIDTNNYEIEIGRSLNIKAKTNLKYNTVYIDYDDTIIVNGEVNTKAIEFLYRCVNKKIWIVLVTKHRANIEDSLARYKINPYLFNHIIQLDMYDDKAKYMFETNAIFIDDSFSERSNVKKKLNIPVISVENIEFL